VYSDICSLLLVILIYSSTLFLCDEKYIKVMHNFDFSYRPVRYFGMILQNFIKAGSKLKGPKKFPAGS